MLRQRQLACRSAPELIVRAAAKAVNREMRPTIAGDLGGDVVMSGLGRAAAKTKTDITSLGARLSIAKVTPAKRARGLWAILEDGTKPHSIAPKRLRRSSVLKIGDDVVSGAVRVRGVRAKRTWTRAIEASRGKTTEDGRAAYVQVMRG